MNIGDTAAVAECIGKPRRLGVTVNRCSPRGRMSVLQETGAATKIPSRTLPNRGGSDMAPVNSLALGV